MLLHNWREVLKRARSVRLTMFALLYIIYLPVNITFVLLAYALSPFLAAWSMKHGPVLPGRWRCSRRCTLIWTAIPRSASRASTQPPRASNSRGRGLAGHGETHTMAGIRSARR